ncbi:MAG: hypothetical protein P8Z00_13975 [Anaerolineales bacterium]|jgi:hypothetical protein
MSDIHREIFELFQRAIDRHTDIRKLRGELQEHLSVCPDCQVNFEIDQALRAQAALRWPAALEPRRPARETVAAMRAAVDRKALRQKMFEPSAAVWIILALLFILGLNWAVASLRPQPASTPKPTQENLIAPPPQTVTPTPEASELELPKTPLQPFATGAEAAGRGLWSPEGQWFFFDLIQTGEDPQSDRRVTTVNFLDPESGEVCRGDQEFLGPVSLSGQAYWLPDGRLLMFSEDEGLQVLAPCGETTSLMDLFSEPILSMPRQDDGNRYILLQGERQYWLLETDTLVARPLEGLLPGMEDRQAWSPSREQLAVYQPGSSDSQGEARITIIDAESGVTARTVDLPPYAEMPVLQWLGEDVMYLYTFTENSPTLVDLSGSELVLTKVLPELFGLNLVYPDEFSSDTAVADSAARNYHIAFKVNSAEDKSTYLYHSESGQVEKLAAEGHTYLIFPNGDLEPMFSAEDELSYVDEFDLVWVDDPEKSVYHLSVSGHTPRDYPILWPRLVPGRDLIAFTSSQGVSLVSIPDGQLQGFWKLEGGGTPNRAVASPDGRFLVVSTYSLNEDGSSSGSAYYLIPVETGE